MKLRNKKQFIDQLNNIFEENMKNERITVPLMKTMESLIRTTYFSGEEYSEEFIRMHQLCHKESWKSRNISKLIT